MRRAKSGISGLSVAWILGAALALTALPGCAPELRRGDVCGDGTLTGAEPCDDGNAAPGDGCDAACAVEPGYTCAGAPSACTPTCGDGVLVAAEPCEGADLGGKGCADVGFSGGTLGCLPDCTLDTSACIALEDCNNGADDDQDGAYDCGDTDCAAAAPCVSQGEVVCDDLEDQDDDDLIDCEDDTDCQALVMCAAGTTPTGGPCAAPHDCQANDTDPFCISQAQFEDWEGGYCSEFCDLVMNDCSGDATCFDAGLASGNGICLDSCAVNSDCRAGYACTVFGVRKLCFPGVEDCTNMVDDENDGAIDCEDPQCAASAACAMCGDGVVAENEQCDDRNQADGDGCTADCKFEGLPESEPNDTCGEPDGPFTPEVVLTGTVSGSDPVDRYVFNLPEVADLRIKLFAPGGCEAVLIFSGPSCGDYISNSCSELNTSNTPQLRAMTPGVYALEVDWNGFADAPYAVEISYDALCGNGAVEGSEECDGGADCTGACKRVTTCGDGKAEGDEQCDDDNTASGDGCSASCLFELKPESEPNDSCALADGPFGPNFMTSGSVLPAGEVDYYAIALAETADLHIETFGAGGPGTCDGDSVIELFSPGCASSLAFNDDSVKSQGFSYCSMLDASQYAEVHDLAAGIYIVAVSAFGGGELPGYTLLVSQNTCGDGKRGGLEECDGTGNCTPDCKLVTDCGDGKIEGDEQCDPPDITSCSLTCNVILPPEGQCEDLWDEDNDGLTDCEDPGECKASSICAPGAGAPGSPCTSPSDCAASGTDPVCFSELNYGWVGGYCAEFCDLNANDCAAGSVCVNFYPFPSGAGTCMQSCAVDSDCRAGYYCPFGFCQQ